MSSKSLISILEERGYVCSRVPENAFSIYKNNKYINTLYRNNIGACYVDEYNTIIGIEWFDKVEIHE